jgi:hypothetical protein
MGSPSIIFSSTVRLPVLYGMLFSVTVGCLGLCLIAWRICLPVGGRVVVLEMLLCGKGPPLPCVVCIEGKKCEKV